MGAQCPLETTLGCLAECPWWRKRARAPAAGRTRPRHGAASTRGALSPGLNHHRKSSNGRCWRFRQGSVAKDQRTRGRRDSSDSCPDWFPTIQVSFARRLQASPTSFPKATGQTDFGGSLFIALSCKISVQNACTHQKPAHVGGRACVHSPASSSPKARRTLSSSRSMAKGLRM